MTAKAEQKLASARKTIDAADHKLMLALAARFKAVDKVGHIKAEAGIPVLQKARWKTVIASKKQQALELGINPDFIEKIYEVIKSESHRLQGEIAKQDKKRK